MKTLSETKAVIEAKPVIPAVDADGKIIVAKIPDAGLAVHVRAYPGGVDGQHVKVTCLGQTQLSVADMDYTGGTLTFTVPKSYFEEEAQKGTKQLEVYFSAQNEDQSFFGQSQSVICELEGGVAPPAEVLEEFNDAPLGDIPPKSSPIVLPTMKIYAGLPGATASDTESKVLIPVYPDAFARIGDISPGKCVHIVIKDVSQRIFEVTLELKYEYSEATLRYIAGTRDAGIVEYRACSATNRVISKASVGIPAYVDSYVTLKSDAWEKIKYIVIYVSGAREAATEVHSVALK